MSDVESHGLHRLSAEHVIALADEGRRAGFEEIERGGLADALPIVGVDAEEERDGHCLQAADADALAFRHVT